MIKIVFIALSFLSLFSFGQEHKATIIKAPDSIPANDKRIKIFLGGSIDMGKAENWQAKLEKDLSPFNVIILNPRREDWNKDWQPVSTDKHFREQVEWELTALESADIIIMYFAPDSQSPISLLEFGMYAKTNKLMVICPEGFWRKGNVDIVSDRYKIKTFETFDELIKEIEIIVE
ncbi:MAG: hypothetical protein C4539_00350 [Ignavibacteriales bacterium]|nr:MAG: hypothetical protein C4539_00350 [Ignavibacteriales bacterium]